MRVRSWELGGMCRDRVRQGLYSVGRAGRAERRYMLSPAHVQFCRRYLAVEELKHMEGLHSLCLFTKKS